MARYIIQKSEVKAGWWVCTDTEHGIVVKWEEHRFNDTQRVTLLEDNQHPKALLIARLMREMGDWLAVHHREKVF